MVKHPGLFDVIYNLIKGKFNLRMGNFRKIDLKFSQADLSPFQIENAQMHFIFNPNG